MDVDQVSAPFEQLGKTILPALISQRRASRRLRIWCAACSSGQEPWSVAMILNENPQLAGWNLEIVATDMSETILTKAGGALYSDFEVRRGLGPERLARWFQPEGGEWRVLPALREIVSFRAHNLLQGVSGLGVFDVILCRNVLIDFDVERKREMFVHLDSASLTTAFCVWAARNPFSGSWRPSSRRRAPEVCIARRINATRWRRNPFP